MEKYTLVIKADFNEIKAILEDENGEEKATSKKELTKFHSESGWIEVDANEIWISTMYVIINLAKNFSINPENICEIGIKSTQETLVVWEKSTGIPVYRAAFEKPIEETHISQNTKEKEVPKQEEDRIGTEMLQYISKKKVNWILEHIEGVKEKAENEKLVFGTVASWIAYRLTGEEVIKTVPEAESEKNRMYGYTDPIHFFGREIPVVSV